jgi:hypothetical protein
MAVLTDEQRAEEWAAFMSDVSGNQEVFGMLTKADIRAAVNALDDYLHTNAAAINQTLPEPARTELTTPQKARLLMRVVARRYLVGA